MSEPRVCIGIPTHKEYCLYKFFINFIQMKKTPLSQTFIYDDQPVSKCRNKIVKHALEWGATHLFFLDDDMIIPDNAMEILLNHDKDIVSLLAFQRKEPFFPVIYKKHETKFQYTTILEYEKGLISVDGTGSACTMIKLDVFRKMSYPWYEFEPDPENSGEVLSEDLKFCQKAKELGFQVWVDTFHSIGHLGIAAVDENVWEKYKFHKYGDLGRSQVDRLGNVIEAPEKILIE